MGRKLGERIKFEFRSKLKSKIGQKKKRKMRTFAPVH